MMDTDRPLVVSADNEEVKDYDLQSRSPEQLEEEIAEICAHIDAATYRLLMAIAELDRREVWAAGFPTMAHWLNWRVGIDLVTARQKVRVARALENLPQIRDAFRQGRISYSKVRAMTRIATPENEEYLLYIAENGTASHMESLVRKYRRATRGADHEEARRQREDQYLDTYTDNDGMVVIRGRLPQEIAALLGKALDAAMDSLSVGQSEEESPGPGSEEDSAESSLPRVPGDKTQASCPPPSGARFRDSAESWVQGDFLARRVDALGLLAEAALGQGLGRTMRGEPYQVMIHVDSAVLADQSVEGLCEFENCEGISPESARRLSCDAPTVTVSENTEGDLLNIGRKDRKVTTRLWRALMTRDRTCQFPGCDKTRHLQAHHIEHWAKGGETNPDNLILLCRAHHWAVHDGGFRVDGRVPHGLVFRRPDGSHLPFCAVRVPIRGSAGETLKEVNRRVGLEITANTVDTFWDGEAIDYHMAVDGLLDCQENSKDDHGE